MGVHRRAALAAIAVSLAAGPVLAQSQTTYLACDIEVGGPESYSTGSIFRLTHEGSVITDWKSWSSQNRAWLQDIWRCGNTGDSRARGGCTTGNNKYEYVYLVDGWIDNVVLIDATSGTIEAELTANGRTSTWQGKCRATTNPELTPAPRPNQ